jgi:hypothetical protein
VVGQQVGVVQKVEQRVDRRRPQVRLAPDRQVDALGRVELPDDLEELDLPAIQQSGGGGGLEVDVPGLGRPVGLPLDDPAYSQQVLPPEALSGEKCPISRLGDDRANLLPNPNEALALPGLPVPVEVTKSNKTVVRFQSTSCRVKAN